MQAGGGWAEESEGILSNLNNRSNRNKIIGGSRGIKNFDYSEDCTNFAEKIKQIKKI